jgi:LPXTG-site transpeptidase (sortase) family protein
MTWLGILIAFLIGLLVTLWLASRQNDYQPLFVPRRRQNTWIWWMVSGLALIGIVSLAYVGISSVWDSGAAATVVQPNAQPHAQARLIIPNLNLNEKIVNVPIKDGEWDISRLSGSIGWLETTGADPNSEQVMTFIGHITVSALQKGPFVDLFNIKPLSEIIYRNGGVDFVYTVQTIQQVKPTDVDKLFQRKKEHLLLVTCTDYNVLTEKYEGRILVDAVLVQRKIAPTQTSN